MIMMMMFWGLAVLLLAPIDGAAPSTCPDQVNTEQCAPLMKKIPGFSIDDCACHDFCDGEYVGCSSNGGIENPLSTSCQGQAVRGCSFGDEDDTNAMANERSLQAPVVNFGGGFQDPWPQGSFSTGPGIPCVNCLSCTRNARPLVACVKNAADTSQCECLPGFRSNGRGGCPPDRTVAGGSIDDEPTVCAVERYRPDPNGPCVPCLSCGDYSFPRTNCVIDRNDLRQCGCHAGYTRSNGQCIPIGSGNLGGQQQPCQAGYYRSSPDPNAPCVQCLRCPWNANAITSCVRNAADPAQCQCKPGFSPNGRGGCLPVAGGSLQQPCQVGRYRPDPNGPCVPCLSCGDHSFPRTNCVIDRNDLRQCGCHAGYNRSNGRCVAIGGGSLGQPCQEGLYRPSANGPCVPCLRCPTNASPATNCVRNTADQAQCPCNAGFSPNGRGFCMPTPGGVPAACPVGYFRSSPQASAPCVPCLKCPLNSYPATNCVRHAADPAQCVCRQGYRANGRGGCLPTSVRSFESMEETASGTSSAFLVVSGVTGTMMMLLTMQL